MPARFIFTVDGGASKTEATLRDAAGAVLASHLAGPCNLYQDQSGGLAAIRTCWAACNGPPPAETCLSAGLAGLSGPGTVAAFHNEFKDFGACLLSSDGYAALVGAFGPTPGALLSIGTGTVACRFDAQGEFTQRGGWGFPAGDRGGGAWLGRELVTAWLEHRDGISGAEGSHPLWQAVQAHVGTTRTEILGWLRTATPGQFAQLVPPLLQAAEAGDDFANRLLHKAGVHVGRLAEAIMGHDHLPLALSGGLATSLSPYLPQDLRAAPIAASALEGAWRIAKGIRPPQYPYLDGSAAQ